VVQNSPPALSAATVHEASGQRGALPREIRPLSPGTRVQGPAFTVLCGPRDNLALHHAIAAAPAGSVIVCHTGGYHDAGYFGDIMARAAAARNIAGLVIDGCVRDYADIGRGPVAVFARGLSVRGTTKDALLPMMLGPRLRIGDVDVDPGDTVVGDDDGVVIISASRLERDVRASGDRETKEAAIRTRIDRGELTTDIYGLPSMRTA
jgi:4-hydroxy-4-methyl-2-oxoglutarate aldolase